MYPVDEFSFKKTRTWGQSEPSPYCFRVWCESRELRDRVSSRFLCVTLVVEAFSLDRVTLRTLSNINDGPPLRKQPTASTHWKRKRSLRSYGLKKWNALPYHNKNSDNLNGFKLIIKCWMETTELAESANIRLQDNIPSQNIILQYLILYGIQREMKILWE